MPPQPSTSSYTYDTYTCTHTHAHTHTCTHVETHIHTHTHKYTSTHTHTHVKTYFSGPKSWSQGRDKAEERESTCWSHPEIVKVYHVNLKPKGTTMMYICIPHVNLWPLDVGPATPFLLPWLLQFSPRPPHPPCCWDLEYESTVTTHLSWLVSRDLGHKATISTLRGHDWAAAASRSEKEERKLTLKTMVYSPYAVGKRSLLLAYTSESARSVTTNYILITS